MPSIPQGFLDCVFYLYATKADALAGKNFGGAGFFVGIKSKTNQGVVYTYACTNWHVAVRDGFSVLRVNTKARGVDVIELDSADWHFTPQGGDLAVAGVIPDYERQHANFIGIERGLPITREEDESAFIGTGDDVLMLGRFIDHDGGQRNQPAARFGNISVRPTELEWVNSGPSVKYYCLDMHSRTGFSGSPVFAYRTPGSTLADALNHNIRLEPTVLRFLGIHCGQFPEEMTLDIDGQQGIVTGASGMTVALPAWHLIDLLNSQDLVAVREQNDKIWKGRAPCAE